MTRDHYLRDVCFQQLYEADHFEGQTLKYYLFLGQQELFDSLYFKVSTGRETQCSHFALTILIDNNTTAQEVFNYLFGFCNQKRWGTQRKKMLYGIQEKL